MKTCISILVHSADFELVPSVIFCPQMPQKLLSVSLMVKQTTKKSKQCCSSFCPENSQNWSFTSCFSPLAAQWFMNTVQTCFSVLQLPQLNCSWLHDSADCSVSNWLNVQNQCWKKLFFSSFFSRENVWTTLCVFTSQLNSIHELDTDQPSSEWALCE